MILTDGVMTSLSTEKKWTHQTLQQQLVNIKYTVLVCLKMYHVKSWLSSMNGFHSMHHVDAKTRRIAGRQCENKIKMSSSRFANPSELPGYLKYFKRPVVCLVHSVVDCPLTVERSRWSFYYLFFCRSDYKGIPTNQLATPSRIPHYPQKRTQTNAS